MHILVEANQKRRCPHCSSDKWEWLEAIPLSTEMFEQYLAIKYRCRKCHKEFTAHEAKGIKLVETIDRCVFCNSRNLEKISRANSEMELYRCKQCHGFMGIK